jgi:membrane protein implicated in regulation of membrane protease activity
VFVSGFFLINFAVGAAVAAVVAFLGYDFVWQLIAFIAVSVVMMIFMRPMANRLTRAGGHNRWGIDRVVGKQAVVLVAIDPLLALGRVRVDREEWQAASVDGTPIAAGALVEVVSVEGTHLKVRPATPNPVPQ